MAAAVDRTHHRPLHPVHAVLIAGTVPLFLGALLSDLAYSSSYEVQWTNFASWLIVGGLVFCGFALMWSIVGLVRVDRRRGRPLIALLLLLTTWMLSLTNALVHAKDAWASMPEALVLSVLVAILAISATWIGFAGFRTGRTT